MIQRRDRLFPSFKVWFTKSGLDVVGEGGAALLRAIEKHGSITEAARQVGVSYKYAWDRLAEIQKTLGHPILRTRRGGKTGGGGAKLTDEAIELLNNYDRTVKYVRRALNDDEHWEAIGLRISARNRIQSTVEKVEYGPVVSKVKMRIRAPAMITAVITREAVNELGIKAGDRVRAVIKATEVMIAKE